MTVDLPNGIIDVPQSDLTLVSGTIYSYGTNTKFRVDLMAIMDNENPMVFQQAYEHTAGKTVAGTVFAPFIQVINNYQVRFEDGQYTVILEESNNDIFDVIAGNLFQNQVQVIPSNSAGLVVAGSGVLPSDITAIATEVWTSTNRTLTAGTKDTEIDSILTAVLASELTVTEIRKIIKNRQEINTSNNTLVVYDDDAITPLLTWDIQDASGSPSSTSIFKRIPQ